MTTKFFYIRYSTKPRESTDASLRARPFYEPNMFGGPLRQYFEIPFHLLKANLEQGVSVLNSPQSDQLD
jgi:hypothetical protein